jgi:hypothetical protein
MYIAHLSFIVRLTKLSRKPSAPPCPCFEMECRCFPPWEWGGLTVVVGQRLYQAKESENAVSRNYAWRRLCSVHDRLQKLEATEYKCNSYANQEFLYNATGQYNTNTFDPNKAISSRMRRFEISRLLSSLVICIHVLKPDTVMQDEVSEFTPPMTTTPVA